MPAAPYLFTMESMVQINHAYLLYVQIVDRLDLELSRLDISLKLQ
jgi:hypothetical protein